MKGDVGETISLWPGTTISHRLSRIRPHIGRCDVRWYGDTQPKVSFDMTPVAKEAI